MPYEFEMTEPSFCEMTMLIAPMRSWSYALCAATATMVAPGAIAWAASTSRVCSPYQPVSGVCVWPGPHTVFSCDALNG